MKLLFALVAVLAATAAHADCLNNNPKAQTSSQHTTLIAGRTINYTATTGFIEVTGADTTSKACVFYTAYTIEGVKRPITFAFNGGPGSSSVWLHLGLMGPQRADLGPDGLSPSNQGLITNDYSPLDTTDVVMIDPVGTGFSHAEGTTPDKNFWGVRNDYVSLGSFVQNYVSQNNRWLSPKFLIGESYGGMRGSLLARYLQSNLGMNLAGVIFISPALSGLALNTEDAVNNVAYWTFFPTYATTAWFHHRIASKYQDLDVEAVYNQAKQFAMTQYRDALDQGDLIDPQRETDIAQQMADWTGLTKQRVLAADLKIKQGEFFENVMGDADRSVGRYDSRFVTTLANDDQGGDPSYDLVQASFTGGINQYFRSELGLNSDQPYTIMGRVGPWPSEDGNEDTTVVGDLAQALGENPHLKVYIASGYFDLACPMGTVEYDLSQMPNGRLLAPRIRQDRYFSGHMVYINPGALAPLKSAIAEFITSQSQ